MTAIPDFDDLIHPREVEVEDEVTDDELAEMWSATFARHLVGRSHIDHIALIERWVGLVADRDGFPEGDPYRATFQKIALSSVIAQLAIFVEQPSLIEVD